MKRIVLVVLGLLLLLGSTVSAMAAVDPAIEAMETLRRGFAGTKDFTADIVQEKHLALMRKTMISKGVVRFKKPDTFYMEIFAPHASRMQLKDNVMTMRLVEQGVTNRMMLPPDEGLKKWFSYLDQPVTTLPEGVDVKAERHGKLWIMQILPKGKGSVKQLALTFDLTGKINRIIIDERNKDRTVLIFRRVQRNVGLRDSELRVE